MCSAVHLLGLTVLNVADLLNSEDVFFYIFTLRIVIPDVFV